MKKNNLMIISGAAAIAIILGIALFLSIGCYDCAPVSSKLSITRNNLESLSMHINAFYLKKLRLPDSLDEISGYTLDGWSNPIIYEKISDTSYIIGSQGADGKRGGDKIDSDISLKVNAAKYQINQN